MESSRTGTQALIKLLAIIGFFAVLAVGIWLLVQGVRAFPAAFSSLASIADIVNRYPGEKELTVDIEKNIVNSGETFTILWNDMGEGTYRFTYACADGVTMSVRTGEGTLRDIACTESLDLVHDAQGLFASVTAKDQRFTDVSFSITFDAATGDDHVQEKRITVVSATVPPKPVATASSTPTVPATPKPTVPKPTTPTQPASTIISIMPQSYANGFVDLRAAYIGIGTMVDGVFVPKASFDEDERAAFRFEVKNIGTKTSDTWTYEIEIPGSDTYTSSAQTGLTPNERATLTVWFDLPESVGNTVTIEADVETRNDTNTRNNDFDWSVRVTE